MYRLLDTSSSYGCTHGMIVGNVICSQGVTISSVHALLSPEIVLNDTLNNFFPAIQPAMRRFEIFNVHLLCKFNGFSFENQSRNSYISASNNQVLSKFAKVPYLNRGRFELLPFFVASKILSLFFSQVDKVFFGILYILSK